MAEIMNAFENEELLNIVTVGHVDHGKSTVIGRLLADAGALPKGKLEAIRENCRRNSKPFEYAFLLDALHNEQDQGITIDTARCFFKSEKRRYIIIDAPGHIEFLKNMVTGASRAEAALMVIDAARGVLPRASRTGVKVTRTKDGVIRNWEVDLKRIQEGLDPDFPLEEGDRIFVPDSAI